MATSRDLSATSSSFWGRVEHQDFSEQQLHDQFPEVLLALLADQTTGDAIVWATDDYAHHGSLYAAHCPITVTSITGEFFEMISPRVLKSGKRRASRTRERAEVFTPSWLCNEQNNLIDDAWFRRPNTFNISSGGEWRTNPEPVAFDFDGPKTWKKYVDEPRIEIACGEAPYLVSRYDTTTGEAIELQERIGLLDRKMRVVAENTTGEEQWLAWAERAFQSVYGFELQGDNLLLARENLLLSYRDYMKQALGRSPSGKELHRIATIISWNLWQMDGFTGMPPFQTARIHQTSLDLFGEEPADPSTPCLIRDWRENKTIEFRSIQQKADKQ